MKTAIEIAEKEIAELWSGPSDQPTYTQIFEVLERVKLTEKQQHEKTAIDMCNICLDNIGNPNSKMEEKFNEYWKATFETNKETLK